jgi:GxxExxY protein
MPDATAAQLNRITDTIIAGAIRIHRTFGSGLLESAYGACLCHDLVKAGLRVERQKRLPLVYDGLKLDCAYRADIVVDDLVLVEVKALETVLPAHRRQINTYMRLGDYRVGLLLNFGAPMMKQGIERIVNRFPDAGRLGS